MEGIVTFSVVCVGFLIYAIFSGAHTFKASEFLLMGRSADTKQYSDTTVAYSLQVAVTIYFFMWGFRYGLANITFILSWFLGLAAFAAATPLLSRFLVKKGDSGSIFSYISNNRMGLQRYMAILFAISLVGVLYTEIYFTSQFVESLAEARSPSVASTKVFFGASFVIVLVVVLMYSSLGGIRKVVATDTWQLSIAYIGSAAFFAGLSPFVAANGGAHAFNIIYISMPILYLTLALMPLFVSVVKRAQPTNWLNGITFLTFSSLIASSIVSSLPLLLIVSSNSAQIPFPKSIHSMLDEPFGWAPVLGYGIINLVWQFSDYTAYHRLSLLSLPEDDGARQRVIRESIVITMLNSPLSWGLGIFAGMAVYASGLVAPGSADVFGDFVTTISHAATQGQIAAKIIVVGLAAFLSGVMLSTVDSGFMSFVLLAIRDFGRQEMSPFHRFVTNTIAVLLMAAFAVMQTGLNINIFVFLNATYSWGLLFACIAFLNLLEIQLSTWRKSISITVGAAGSAYVTLRASDMPDMVALVAPSLAAIALSSILFLPELISVAKGSSRSREFLS